MAIITPRDLTEEAAPLATAWLVVDTGSAVRKTAIEDVVAVGRPIASQAEAEAGTNADKAMTPLTTKQAHDYRLTQADTITGIKTFTPSSLTGQSAVVKVADDTASAGPYFDIVRNSASPAASDIIGAVRLVGMDSGGNETPFAQFRAWIVDPTDGSEDGLFQILIPIAGSQTSVLSGAPGLVVGNATGGQQGLGTVNATRFYRNGTALPDISANTFTAAQSVTPVALTDGATITPDLTLGNYFTVTLGGNRTLANPSSMTVGTSFLIVITQDGTGSRTLSFGSQYLFAGGTDPTLSTAAGAIDVISGYVHSSTQILCNIAKAFA